MVDHIHRQHSPFLWQRLPFPSFSSLSRISGSSKGRGEWRLLSLEATPTVAMAADGHCRLGSPAALPLCSLYIPFLLPPTFSFLASNLRKPPLQWWCWLELELRPSAVAPAAGSALRERETGRASSQGREGGREALLVCHDAMHGAKVIGNCNHVPVFSIIKYSRNGFASHIRL